jgi:hypothetical protein
MAVKEEAKIFMALRELAQLITCCSHSNKFPRYAQALDKDISR